MLPPFPPPLAAADNRQIKKRLNALNAFTGTMTVKLNRTVLSEVVSHFKAHKLDGIFLEWHCHTFPIEGTTKLRFVTRIN